MGGSNIRKRKMEIQIRDHQKKLQLNPAQIKKIVRIILQHEEINDAELSFVFVTHQKISAFNKKYLKRNYATDVLAFESLGWQGEERNNKNLAGDIMISTDAVLKNHKLYGMSLAQELSLYVIHGILHLIGFDDHSKKDITKMRKKEDELMRVLGKMINPVIRHS